MKNIITMAACLCSLIIYSQVGINTNNPQASLDITAKTTNGSKPEGLIAPRLTGDQIQAGDAQYGTAQKGAIIYATAAATSVSSKTANITSEGYYYFDGTAWQKITGGASAGDTTNDAWINDTTNSVVKLGTKADGTARTAGTEFVVNDNGSVGIGTNLPTAKLEISSGVSNTSGVKLTNLTSTNVLATDSNGNIISGNNSNSGVIITKQRLTLASPSVVVNSASGDFSFRYNSTGVSGFVQIRFNKTGTRSISTFITENWVNSPSYNGYFVSSSSATLSSNTWTNIPGSSDVGQTGELNVFRIYDLSNGITYILELNLVNNSGVSESMILQEY
ncbi:hypothetical protein QF023_002576 [Chryseobacterium sp. SLBN-27]|uniref:hypothetical protein n=1 Tax=Chryseobacterium sp. SLBN-27 TaxID=3042287 RepID=UPI0028617570|nr:hypothetical protein [Chryseobacterium sp. SLBN-27]MDR6159060.1 hypothetical protein [Chryseobacterium sp. SLBN-27]